MTAANIAVVLLAAGLSRRMGQDKLLKRLPNGARLLEDRIHAIIASGTVPYVAIPDDPQKSVMVEATSAVPVQISNDVHGMGDSISAAIRALPDTITGIMIMLSDLPDVTCGDLRGLMVRFDGKTILRAATEDGTPGHPVIFPVRYRPSLELLSGAQGARTLLQSEPVDLHPLPGQNAVRDLDTPDDWKAWESERLTPPKK
ncbi:NTP transferase domain-containing protein [Aliiroseovarius sp. PrR006]|uniref:nucleotidyltransferase family protein n=1 Tax=Aliiroseovarius sp. PrR006 TaxID=2706883 RepID=UPI0013D5505C|nr:nucleotidyltransferase family protein [Aliiroseovarius sp. PrR006]NDW52213.1 nucleotidyltransferase family protein [Aliiroseovarius sp. PrR006]